MFRKYLSTLALGAALCGGVHAQSLVKDINTIAINPGSTPTGLTSVILGTQVFFSATDPGVGTELFRTDGTAAGTFLVKDIYPGSTGTTLNSSNPSGFFSFGTLVLFRATDATNGTELWISDGTAAGTTLLKDINPGTGSSSPSGFTLAGPYVYFQAADATGTELWRTDFTAAGTVQVKDINTTSATASSFPMLVAGRYAGFGGKLYFTANDGVSGQELWVSDGTAAGTQLLLDINTTTSTAGSTPNSMMVAGGKLFFFASDGVNGTELWATDGTVAGTAMVKDINLGSASSGSIQEITVELGGVLLFTATEASSGHELWRSDGTAAGTFLVKDFNSGIGNGASSLSTSAAKLGSILLITADDGVNGSELWRTDGTTAGTSLVADMYPGAATNSSTPTEMVVNGGLCYFSAYNPATGVELWRTDGTTAGTTFLCDCFLDIDDGIPRLITPIGSKVVFQAITLISGNRELFVSDGTPAGSGLLKDLNPPSATATTHANPGNLTVYNGKLYFGANSGVNGNELWVSDGTAAGTQMLLDINPGSATGFNGPIRVVNGLMIFQATTLAAGTELWRSDGTAAGTFMIKDANPGPGTGSNGNNQTFAVYGNQLLYAGNDGSTGIEIWTSDGTAAGTHIVSDINPTGSSSPLNLFVSGPYAYCSATGPAGDIELVRTDGTAAGTIFMDLNPGSSASSFPINFTFFAGKTFMTVTTAAAGSELWTTDGTLAGTSLFLDIRPGTSGSSPTQYYVFNGRLYFQANDGSFGAELWSTDGTVAGTAMVLDINPGTAASSPAAFANVNGTLFFRAGNALNGTELWKTDGTGAGTVLVKDIQVGTGSGYFSLETFQAGSGTLVLIAGNDGTSGSGTGSEVWRSDGTAAGTTRVADINPGTASASPASFTRLGSTVFFTANDGVKGIELWSMPLSTVGATLVENIGQGCPGTGGLIPKSGTQGLPSIGNAGFGVTVTNGLANSPCVLLLSTSPANTPIGGGCFLFVNLPVIDLANATNAVGSALQPLPIPPNISFLGGELWWQWGVVDPLGAFSNVASISNGLHTMFGN